MISKSGIGLYAAGNAAGWGLVGYGVSVQKPSIAVLGAATVAAANIGRSYMYISEAHHDIEESRGIKGFKNIVTRVLDPSHVRDAYLNPTNRARAINRSFSLGMAAQAIIASSVTAAFVQFEVSKGVFSEGASLIAAPLVFGLFAIDCGLSIYGECLATNFLRRADLLSQ